MKHNPAIALAEAILELADKAAECDAWKAEALHYRGEYTKSLQDGIEHGEHMMAGFLKMALMPNFQEAMDVLHSREGSIAREAGGDEGSTPKAQEPGPLAGAPNKCHQDRAAMATPTPQEPT